MAVMKIKTDGSDAKKVEEGLREFMATEGFRLTCRRYIKINPEATVSLLDYILGNAWLLGKNVPPEIMAKVMVAILYHAKSGYNHLNRSIVFRTINQELLNNPGSERVTSPSDVKLPKGLRLRSKIFFSLEAKIQDENHVTFTATKVEKDKVGDFIVLTEDGVYRWLYSYVLVPEGHIRNALVSNLKYRKNLTSNVRYLPVTCSFTPMGQKDFEELFTVNPELFMNLAFRIHKQLQYQQSEMNRITMVFSEKISKLWRMLSVLSHR